MAVPDMSRKKASKTLYSPVTTDISAPVPVERKTPGGLVTRTGLSIDLHLSGQTGQATTP
jgi:hypothetical protein